MTIETKFNIGDEVWFRYHKTSRHCVKGVIRWVNATAYTEGLRIKYCISDGVAPYPYIGEEYVFRTKQELLDSL